MSIMYPNDTAYTSSFTSPPKVSQPKPSAPLLSAETATVMCTPRRPLSPTRLAKLANALGVLAPIPINSNSSFKRLHYFRYFSTLPPATQDESIQSRASLRSKYIHVIPPSHFPDTSESDSEGQSVFRRGILLSLRPNLKDQISVISREYDMPTVYGISLYLVYTSGKRTEPNARITEEVWRRLWTLVTDGREGDEFWPSSSDDHILESLMTTDMSSPPTFEESAIKEFTLTTHKSFGDCERESTSAVHPLFKVRFDIDRTNSDWYEVWSRSRRDAFRRKHENVRTITAQDSVRQMEQVSISKLESLHGRTLSRPFPLKMTFKANLDSDYDSKRTAMVNQLPQSEVWHKASSFLDNLDDKREGGVYDSFGSSLISSDIDEDLEEEDGIFYDAHWRQMRMTEELDVLEKSIAELSPRQLKSTETKVHSPRLNAFSSQAPLQNLSSVSSSSTPMTDTQDHEGLSLTPTIQYLPAMRPSTEMDAAMAVASVFHHSEISDTAADYLSLKATMQPTPHMYDTSWPSIPFASIRDRVQSIFPPQLSREKRSTVESAMASSLVKNKSDTYRHFSFELRLDGLDHIAVPGPSTIASANHPEEHLVDLNLSPSLSRIRNIGSPEFQINSISHKPFNLTLSSDFLAPMHRNENAQAILGGVCHDGNMLRIQDIEPILMGNSEIIFGSSLPNASLSDEVGSNGVAKSQSVLKSTAVITPESSDEILDLKSYQSEIIMTVPFGGTQSPKHSRSDSALDPFHFDQESIF